MKLFQMIEILLQQKEKTGKTRVTQVSTYYPALKNLNSILRINLPILYTKEGMADLFKDPRDFLNMF